MTTHTETVQSLFRRWQAEDLDLEKFVDGVRDWMNDVSQLGFPRFGEMATRLQELRERLQIHFAREDEIGLQLETFYPLGSVELGAVRRQADRDHGQLLDQIRDLIGRLDELDPPFVSWQSAMHEVELFVVALERHEDQESESIRVLLPMLED